VIVGYKEYRADIQYDDYRELYIGVVESVKPSIRFAGRTYSEAVGVFVKAVDSLNEEPKQC
jgi:hypothetical protein